MAGKRQFDEAATMEVAVDLFWRNGFEATSMDAVAEQVGVKRGSLFNAYGDKQAFFLRVLESYRSRFVEPMQAATAEADPASIAEAFLRMHLARMKDPKSPTGCLVASTTLECSDRYPEIASAVAAQNAAATKALANGFGRAGVSELLRSGYSPKALAEYLVTVSRGLAVMHRAGSSVKQLEQTAKVALVIFV